MRFQKRLDEGAEKEQRGSFEGVTFETYDSVVNMVIRKYQRWPGTTITAIMRMLDEKRIRGIIC